MTNRQKQCLLSYLGLYNGAIDGIWGARSREAEADFVRLYGEFSQANLLKALEKPADLWADIPNFTREEFRSELIRAGLEIAEVGDTSWDDAPFAMYAVVKRGECHAPDV